MTHPQSTPSAKDPSLEATPQCIITKNTTLDDKKINRRGLLR